MSADIVNEVVKESCSLLWMHRDQVTVIKSGDWLEDFILEPIGPMLPRVVGTSFFCSIIQLIFFICFFFLNTIFACPNNLSSGSYHKTKSELTMVSTTARNTLKISRN